MLSLEPRASDDETLDSEASIGTGDSSENLNVDSEETISDFSGRSFTPNVLEDLEFYLFTFESAELPHEFKNHFKYAILYKICVFRQTSEKV